MLLIVLLILNQEISGAIKLFLLIFPYVVFWIDFLGTTLPQKVLATLSMRVLIF